MQFVIFLLPKWVYIFKPGFAECIFQVKVYYAVLFITLKRRGVITHRHSISKSSRNHLSLHSTFSLPSSTMAPAKEEQEAEIHSWREQLPYTNPDCESPLYHSQCHCGRLRFSVNTAPLDAKLCHCRDCRVLHGAPMQHAAIFEKRSVHFEEGSLDFVQFYANEMRRNQGNQGDEAQGEACPGRPGNLLR